MRSSGSLWQPGPARIAVFRALQLGDMLCAVPALRALRKAAPQARITLIGLPWAQEFVRRFRRYVDDLLVFPGFPGMTEQASDIAALPRFFQEAQQREFDLTIQLHGSGAVTNVIGTLLGAKHQAGFYMDHAYRPNTRYFMPWPGEEPEITRYLQLMHFLGVPLQGEELEFPLFAEDVEALKVVFDTYDLQPGRYLCMHPGARLPSRRWSAQRFGAVAQTLAEQGYRIVLTGSAAERPIADKVLHCTQAPIVNLMGKTGLGTLVALIDASGLLVCNDTGVSHIAAAVGTPSVVVACGGSVGRWAPLNRQRHRVLFHAVNCRPCEHYDCPIGHPCADGVSTDAVAHEAFALLRRGVRHDG
ncbi:MAG TPA: glycosyltransferase family 9 protein [Burkholderiales bacterium]|nr:glycosyltransferase family 9 protein [Burkholderiales bacterium]